MLLLLLLLAIVIFASVAIRLAAVARRRAKWQHKLIKLMFKHWHAVVFVVVVVIVVTVIAEPGLLTRLQRDLPDTLTNCCKSKYEIKNPGD